MDDDTKETTVRVSMRDIYLEVQRLGKLLDKLANILPSTEDKIQDHENRIRGLERRVAWAVGGFGLAAAVMPFLVRFIP